jgi:hypothetical protein
MIYGILVHGSLFDLRQDGQWFMQSMRDSAGMQHVHNHGAMSRHFTSLLMCANASALLLLQV